MATVTGYLTEEVNTAEIIFEGNFNSYVKF